MDLAWECLRRCPRYIEDWDNLHRVQSNDFVQSYFDICGQRKWGLLKYIDPKCDSAESVFWDFDYSNRSLNVITHPVGNISINSVVNNLSKFHQKKIKINNDCICIKLYNKNGYLQLFFNERVDEKEFENSFLYFSANNDTTRFKRNLDFLLTGVDKYKNYNKINLYLEILRMHDCLLQGFSYKEIATHFYGKRLTESEWGRDSWLRARIRYKLKKANELINYRYCDYL
ncbi:DNA -binding domain-containing protein [Yokenella regensburgei]|uniref:DNA -binding domain-containing protein n=1 Tax=Yokenella regensburgei TaxID=158877 RepID=UPI001375B732|nr:DUF2285 domain-containing protein [Yokenella regensburgei]KAF1366371.1 hypothetical protein FHR25_005162 [Yokenella regensburgei]